MRLLLLITITILSACSLPRWPVDGRMTSPFGLRTRGFWLQVHRGVDIAAPAGSAVRAMAGGRVVHAGWMGGYGLTVVIDHGGEVETLYAHLGELRVEAGDRIDGRDVIGVVGRSGDATGAHLHFEIRRNGRAEDPVGLLGGSPGGR